MQRTWISIVSVAALAAAAGTASADPLFGVESYDGPSVSVLRPPHQPHRPAWYELGFVRSTYTATTIGAENSSQPIISDTVRFGIGFNVAPHVYLGGDADFGTISNAAPTGTDVGGRSQVMQIPGYDSTIHGTTGAARAFAGLSAGNAAFTAAGELALGARIETTDGNNIMGEQAQQDLLLEGRGRLSLRLSPAVTLAGIAAVDLRDHRDVSLGLALDFHMYAVGR